MLPALSRAREAARRASCANNLKQIGLTLKMYSNESKGQKYPPQAYWECARSRGQFMVDAMAIFPEYLTDPAVLLCPSYARGTGVDFIFRDANDVTEVYCNRAGDKCPTTGVGNRDFYPCEVTDNSCGYIYLGWNTMIPGITDGSDAVGQTRDEIITWLAGNNADLMFILTALKTAIDDPVAGDSDATASLTGGDATIYRLREGIERFVITDINNPSASAKAQSEIPVCSDWVSIAGSTEFNHIPGGSNVLWMDGHVEFLRYPSGWPVNRTMAALMVM